MPRSGADARRRLQQAALELYRAHGFDRTTTADIAARAGVNERTFFRHFPDKREVLFDGEAEFASAVSAAIADVPVGTAPLPVLLRAFEQTCGLLEANREFSGPRADVIAATPALRERELVKGATLAGCLADALRRRGVEPGLAGAAADIGWTLFARAVRAWIREPPASLAPHLRQAFDDLRVLTAPGSGDTADPSH